MPGRPVCSRCGTPLPGSDPGQVCPACGRFHDAPPEGVPRRASAPTHPRPRRGPRPPLVAAVATVVVVGLVLFALVALLGSGGGDSGDAAVGVVDTDLSPTSGDVLALPGPLDGTAEVVVLASRVGGDGGRVVALASLTEGARWEAAVVPDDVYSARFAATDEVVLASLEREVVGLDRDDGGVLWRGEASDGVDPSCPACFVVVDDTLLAVGLDGEVTAFDVGTGEIRWVHRFASVQGQVVPVDDAVVLVDDPPDDAPDAVLALTVVAAVDGEERRRILPTCIAPDGTAPPSWAHASPDDPVVAVPGSTDVILAFGSDPGCVQRWSTATGEQVWSRTADVRLDWYSADDGAVVLGDGRLVLLGYDAWLVVGLAEGGTRVIPHAPDTQPGRTALLRDGFLVTTRSTTRGTPEWSVVGHDARTGEELWTHDLGDDVQPLPVAPSRSSGTVGEGWGTGFTVAAGPRGPLVARIGPPGNRISVDAVDATTGTPEPVGTDEVRTDSESSISVRVEALRDDRALVAADGVLHVVDLANGRVVAAWGR